MLGTHVKQAGSFVGPDRLRFDFSHHEAVSPDDLVRIEALANEQVISDAPVRHYETTKAHAESIGAIAFFGDKYGDIVRVLEAGPASTELCGGTHVHALGFIGPIKIVSEGSIGSNLRRIEAVTGTGALERIQDEEQQLRDLAGRLGVAPAELGERVDKLLAQVKSLNDEVSAARKREAAQRRRRSRRRAPSTAWSSRAATASVPTTLRQLAVATRDALGPDAVVVLLGVNDGKAGIAAALGPGTRRGRWIRRRSWSRRSRSCSAAGRPRTPSSSSGAGPNVAAVDDALAAAEAGVTELAATSS